MPSTARGSGCARTSSGASTEPSAALSADLVLAVDIGGTKLAAGLVDRDGDLVASVRSPTPQGAAAEELWEALAGLVREAVHKAPPGAVVVACGVGTGGPMEPDGESVSPLNIGGWRGFPLRRRLAEMTGLPTFVDNDAKALALAEGWRGAATGRCNFIAMVVSTGIGGGIVLDGRLLDGRLGNAGHIGHVIVVPDGRSCACGGRGCLEAEASGLSIAAMTGRPAATAPHEVVERTGILVGRAVASVSSLLDLDLAVVSGSVALGYGEGFVAAAQRELSSRAKLSFSRGARIVPGLLGGAGPLVGAGAVGWRGLNEARSDEEPDRRGGDVPRGPTRVAES